MKSIITLFIIVGFGISGFAAENKKTNLNSYLEEVKKNNPAYKATLQASEGAKLRSTEGTLIILPQLQVEALHGVDESENTMPTMQGDKTSHSEYNVSLLQNTTFGLSGKLSYGHSHTNIENSSLSMPEYNENTSSIELTQSLWKNGFGSEVRAQRAALNAQAAATQYAERAKNLGVIIEAQNTYYKLYYAQKTVDALKTSTEVAGKLKAWAKKRLDQALGEKSDYYLTKSAYELREIEYVDAQENLKAAMRAYNSLRGIDSDVVTENLDAPQSLAFNKKSYSEKVWSDETRAAAKASEAAKAKSLLGKETNRPTLDIFGKYGWNGLGSEARAYDESFKDDYPAYAVGVRFSTPLALGKSYDVRKGYELEAMAADLNFKRKSQEAERDYNNLASKVENATLKLKLASNLEESQKIKVEEERRRHGRGRTTFYQVLQFEQDYVSSQLNKIKAEAELNSLLTQLQMYRGE